MSRAIPVPTRLNVTSPRGPAAIGPYSHGVWAGDLLYLSGQTPIDPATGRLIEGDVQAQCPGGGTTGCPPSLAEDAANAHDRVVTGNVLFAAGIGLTTIAGVGWMISAASSPAEPPRVALTIVPNGVRVLGRF